MKRSELDDVMLKTKNLFLVDIRFYDAEKGKSFFSRVYDINIVDRVGGGDSFTAGLIYSIIMKKAEQDAIEFATAASCLKHTLEGDYNRTTVDDVENLLNCGGNGRVQR